MVELREVMAFDPRIRYCAVLDAMGRTIEGGMRPGLLSLEPDEEADKVDLQMVLIRGITEGARGYLGGVNYVIIHREKLMLIAIPASNGRTILVSAEPDFPLERAKAFFELVKLL